MPCIRETPNCRKEPSRIEEVVFMKYGSQFEKVFKEAMKSPDFWLEDIQLSFLDSLLHKKYLAERTR